MSTSGHKLNRVAVFCGANAGTRPEYLQSANEVGQELVKRKIGLVYGGLLFNSTPRCAVPCSASSFLPVSSRRRQCWHDGCCGANREFTIPRCEIKSQMSIGPWHACNLMVILHGIQFLRYHVTTFVAVHLLGL